MHLMLSIGLMESVNLKYEFFLHLLIVVSYNLAIIFPMVRQGRSLSRPVHYTADNKLIISEISPLSIFYRPPQRAFHPSISYGLQRN